MPFTAILREQKIACIRLNMFRLLYTYYITQIKTKMEREKDIVLFCRVQIRDVFICNPSLMVN